MLHDTSELAQIVTIAKRLRDSHEISQDCAGQHLLRPTREILAKPVTARALLQPSHPRYERPIYAQICTIVDAALEETRSKLRERAVQTVRATRSLAAFGLEDIHHEELITRAFETGYTSYVQEVRRVLSYLQVDTPSATTSRANGFNQRTTCILEASFRYTTTPTVADVDRLAQLTGLQTHQFQNKRNRRNKRVTSSSAIERPIQPPPTDGRRVASLPSRAKASASAGANGGRATRPLPKRYVPISRATDQPIGTHATAPLERTLSHESDSTNFSYSSIPSNGGFTAPTYPTMPAVNANADMTSAPAPEHSSQLDNSSSSGINFDQLDLSSLVPELDFDLDALLNSLAPPNDDFALSADFDAQIQAAMRPVDPSAFANLTLAPSPSLSFGSSASSFSTEENGGEAGGEESPLSELDFSQWLPDLSQDEVAAMEMMKVFLQAESLSPTSEYGPTEAVAGETIKQAQAEEKQQQQGMRSESPAETVADIALHSGRASPNEASVSVSPTTMTSTITTSVSVQSDFTSTFEFDFDLDFEAMELDSKHPQHPHPQQYHYQQAEGSASGSGWMMGVLPFDMGDNMEMTA